MEWTQKPPTTEGFYWYKDRISNPIPVCLRWGDRDKRLRCYWIERIGVSRMNETPDYFAQYGAWWSSEPIPLPSFDDIGEGI